MFTSLHVDEVKSSQIGPYFLHKWMYQSWFYDLKNNGTHKTVLTSINKAISFKLVCILLNKFALRYKNKF